MANVEGRLTRIETLMEGQADILKEIRADLKQERADNDKRLSDIEKVQSKTKVWLRILLVAVFGMGSATGASGLAQAFTPDMPAQTTPIQSPVK